MDYDWSYHLIRAEQNLRDASESLNRGDFGRADEQLSDVLHHGRMARVWIVKHVDADVTVG
jgi:hypothetical protein